MSKQCGGAIARCCGGASLSCSAYDAIEIGISTLPQGPPEKAESALRRSKSVARLRTGKLQVKMSAQDGLPTNVPENALETGSMSSGERDDV